jgi:hypothetical protein
VGVLYVRPRLCWWAMLARYQGFDDYTENFWVAEILFSMSGWDMYIVCLDCNEY